MRISEKEWKALYPNMRVALNPTKTEAVRLVNAVQARCRVNRLAEADVRKCLESVASGQAESACIGLRDCPGWFDYGIDTTVLQVLRLGDDLIGLIALRKHIEPGEHSAPQRNHPDNPAPSFAGYPVPEYLTIDPVTWHNAVMQYFWAHLDEHTTEQLRERMLATLMRLAAIGGRGAANARGARLGFRRHLQVQTLFFTSHATHISELRDSLTMIADDLSAEGKEGISWAGFQRRWPSISARYRRDLLGIQNNGRITNESLRTFQGLPGKYLLTFDRWCGDQRVFPTEQLVFQINAPELFESWENGSDTEKQVMATVTRDASFNLHPVTPTTVGWLRVHVDDTNRLCFVDEVQSDLLEKLRTIQQNDPALAACAADMAKQLSDWSMHGFATVARWSRMIRYRIAMHSPETAALVPGHTTSERKWNTYYAPLIKRFDLEPVCFEEYGGNIYCARPVHRSGA